MNCREIDRILDEHALAGLSAAQKGAFDAHLAACARCRQASAAQAVLEAERPEAPRADLFAAATRRAVNQSAALPPPSAVRTWQSFGGLGAAAALVMVVVLALATIGPGDPRPESATTRSIEPPASAQAPFIEGEHYLRLAARSASTSGTGAAGAPVAVIEFFMYLCNHCYRLEFRFDAWAAEQAPDRVSVSRVPVQWNSTAVLHARAFYAAEQLGVADEAHLALFEEIHDNGNALASQDDLRRFFARFGVDSATFDATFRSASIDAELDRARRLADRFGIAATPTVVVAEEYVATPGTAGSYDALVDLVEWLVERIADACDPSQGSVLEPSRCPADRMP